MPTRCNKRRSHQNIYYPRECVSILSASCLHFHLGGENLARAHTNTPTHKRKACARQQTEAIENEKEDKIKMETNRVGGNDTYAKRLFIHVAVDTPMHNAHNVFGMVLYVLFML